MSEEKPGDGAFKYIIGLLIVVGIRILPRPPNVEPIMATCMPFSKGYGWMGGTLFTMAAIVIYDLITRTVGPWSIVTATTYGLVAFGAYFYLRNRENTVRSYVTYSIIGTLFFDIVTGIGMGYFIFKIPLTLVVAGQIPFTLMHLASSMITAAASPMIYRWVVTNPNLEASKLFGRLASRA
ncbi:MAG TPA: hypothetical protein ENN13_03505 [Candidatus Altiarchaeales archaeon]|nr:hypothetical protein [Candidatus Altiarchaeales archaeon]